MPQGGHPPHHSSWLIEMKFLFEIFSHARDDKGMSVHGQHLSDPAYVRPCMQIFGKEGQLRVLFLEIFEDRERLHQGRTVAVEERRQDHLWAERSRGRGGFAALEETQ